MEEELNLKEIWNVVWAKRSIIISIIIVAAVIGTIYTLFFVTPKYTSKTTMVLAQTSSNEGQTASITQADIAINSKLVSTYGVLVKSDLVVGETIKNLNIKDLTIEDIKRSIKVSLEEESEVIKILVTNEDPNNAAKIANELAKVFSKTIVEIYDLDNVYIVDKAVPSVNPSNINHVKDIVIFVVIGIVVAGAFVVIDTMLDNTIKSEEDVEKIKGLVVIGSIPMGEEKLKKNRGKNHEKGSNRSKRSKFSGRRSI